MQLYGNGCHAYTHGCSAVTQTCVAHVQQKIMKKQGDEYHMFSSSKVTTGRNTSSVDIDDANNDDDDNPGHDYLKLIPAVSSNQK